MKLDPDFARRMAEATALTRAGRIADAVASLQSALAGARAAPRPAGPASAGVVADFCDVIDVEAREVPADVGVPASAPPGDARADSPGGAEQVSGRFTSGRHAGKAGARDFKLYVPPAPRAGGAPLVVMLHGCTQHPDDFAAGTRMNAVAGERGWLVLYPAQTDAVNPARCWSWFKRSHQRRDAGEPAILAGMVGEVIAHHDVDPGRVYVAGLSAGGAMAAILGEVYPDLFAAVGVHSGLPAGAATDARSALAAMRGGPPAAPPRPARCPTIVFHGDRDTTVHPANAERLVPAAGGGGLARERLQGHEGRPYTRHVQRDAAGRTVAEHWLVHGAGHAWSGGSPAGRFTDPLGPCATREMLRFFAGHEKADRALPA